MNFQDTAGAVCRALTGRKDGPSLYDICDPVLLRHHGGDAHLSNFGLFAAPTVISYLAQNGNYSSNPILDQEGFSQQTVMTPSTNNYLSP